MSLCKPGSIAAIDSYNVEFSKVQLNAQLCAIRDNQMIDTSKVQGVIGLNPKPKTLWFLGQILEKYNTLPPIIGFFLRDSYFKPTSLISIGGFF